MKEFKHVLLVEDKATHRNLLKTYLEDMGFLCTACKSKEEAIKWLKTNHPDWALIDIALHSDDDYDGIELAKHIYDKQPIPIMYMTSMGDNHFRRKCEDTGFARWSEKINKLKLTNEATFKRTISQFLEDAKSGRYDFYSKDDKRISINVNGHLFIPREIACIKIFPKKNIRICFQDDNPPPITSKLALKSFCEGGNYHAPYLAQINSKCVVNVRCIVNWEKPQRKQTLLGQKWKDGYITVAFKENHREKTEKLLWTGTYRSKLTEVVLKHTDLK